MAVALWDLGQPHASLHGLVASLAVLSGLQKIDVTFGSENSHETLVPDHVPTLSVGVDLTILRPLTKASVLSLWNGRNCLVWLARQTLRESIKRHNSISYAAPAHLQIFLICWSNWRLSRTWFPDCCNLSRAWRRRSLCRVWPRCTLRWWGKGWGCSLQLGPGWSKSSLGSSLIGRENRCGWERCTILKKY